MNKKHLFKALYEFAIMFFIGIAAIDSIYAVLVVFADHKDWTIVSTMDLLFSLIILSMCIVIIAVLRIKLNNTN